MTLVFDWLLTLSVLANVFSHCPVGNPWRFTPWQRQKLLKERRKSPHVTLCNKTEIKELSLFLTKKHWWTLTTSVFPPPAQFASSNCVCFHQNKNITYLFTNSCNHRLSKCKCHVCLVVPQWEQLIEEIFCLKVRSLSGSQLVGIASL